MSGIGVGFFSAASATERVRISNKTALRTTLNVAATATYRLSSTGVASASNAAGTLIAISGEWLVTGSAGDYQVQGTWQTGTGATGGPTGWVALSTTRDYTLTAGAGNGTVDRDLFVEIRDATTLSVLDTATISFSATSEI